MRLNESKWKEIWEKRTDRLDNIDMTDQRSVFLELKRIDGFDVVGDGISYDALMKQNDGILQRLSKYKKITSVFDCGCGCGANLYLFRNQGLTIGGIDYSEALIKIAEKILGDSVKELACTEALNVQIDKKYDAVFSNSVFSYFPDQQYAEGVLDKLLLKAESSIGLIDVHDENKKEAFIEYRRANIENYDERYKDLPKLFYPKDFFMNWAERNNLEVEFHDSNVEGYWNKEFVFDVYFYRKHTEPVE